MIISRKVGQRWQLFFDDAMGMQVGHRIERGHPLPRSLDRFSFDTSEEAEVARLDAISYITKHDKPRTKKRK